MVAHDRLGERDRDRDAGSVAEDARGVPPACRVLDQPGVARAEDALSAVAQADLELAGEHDDELAARGRVPVEVLADRPLAETDLRRRQPLRPLPCPAEVDQLEARRPVLTRGETGSSPPGLPSGPARSTRLQEHLQKSRKA